MQMPSTSRTIALLDPRTADPGMLSFFLKLYTKGASLETLYESLVRLIWKMRGKFLRRRVYVNFWINIIESKIISYCQNFGNNGWQRSMVF